MKRAILASTSTLYGQKYLSYLLPEISELYNKCKEIIFVPYARPGGISHENYTQMVKETLKDMSFKVKGLHEFKNPYKAMSEAEGIFIGGGNTFVLVDKLYRNNLMELIREKIWNGTPYLGTSAGTNICGLTMQTTNDMPIVYPSSFKTLGIVPFNLNPHYLDADINSTHKGETRETRIAEFHSINTHPVVGLREGSWLELKEDKIILRGTLSARIFKAGEAAYELEANSSLTKLN